MCAGKTSFQKRQAVSSLSGSNIRHLPVAHLCASVLTEPPLAFAPFPHFRDFVTIYSVDLGRHVLRVGFTLEVPNIQIATLWGVLEGAYSPGHLPAFREEIVYPRTKVCGYPRLLLRLFILGFQLRQLNSYYSLRDTKLMAVDSVNSFTREDKSKFFICLEIIRQLLVAAQGCLGY
jgi:hypothetical protein